MGYNPMEYYLEKYPPTPEAVRDPGREEAEESDLRMSPRRLPIQRTIDLHGHTVESAREALDRFVGEARSAGTRKILIIHGKGIHGGRGGIMRDFVKGYLEKNPEIGMTGIPSIQDGGSGATWAIVRHRSR